MRQVSPQDNLFLHMESSTTPMHVGLLCIYHQETADGGQVRFKDIIRNTLSRIHKVPAMRQRLVSTPLQLDYPYWIDDPNFDIEFHIRHIALPKPGDWRQLCIQVARINSRPLDLNRPLWEVTVIEGLDNIEGLPPGCFAIFGKMHRAIFDRNLGGQILAAFHDLSADAKISMPEYPLTVDRIPTELELLSRATLNRVKILGSYVNIASKYAWPAAKKIYQVLCKSKSCSFGRAPTTRFNHELSPHRVFAGTSFALEDIHELKAMYEGARFNDIVTAIVAGALHRYLYSKNELPDHSLTAMIPILQKPEQRAEERLHHFAYVFPRLFTEIKNDIKRTERLVEHLAKSRKQSGWLDWEITDDAARLFPNTLADIFLKGSTIYQKARHKGPFFNTFISSMAGPHIPLYHTGAQLLSCYGTDSLYSNIGLAHNAFSYNGTLHIAINCCRNMMPDPDYYIDCLNDSFVSLAK